MRLSSFDQNSLPLSPKPEGPYQRNVGEARFLIGEYPLADEF